LTIDEINVQLPVPVKVSVTLSNVKGLLYMAPDTITSRALLVGDTLPLVIVAASTVLLVTSRFVGFEIAILRFV
jgi:hypothetical protein